jgi:hypothetical protein
MIWTLSCSPFASKDWQTAPKELRLQVVLALASQSTTVSPTHNGIRCFATLLESSGPGLCTTSKATPIIYIYKQIKIIEKKRKKEKTHS